MWSEEVRKEWIDALPLGTGQCLQVVKTIVLKYEFMKEAAPDVLRPELGWCTLWNC